MDSLYIILLALILLVIIPWITRQRRMAAVRHILNRKKQNKENSAMKELAKQFMIFYAKIVAEKPRRYGE